MENIFYVSVCRFHTKDKRKIVVVGNFNRNLMGDQCLIPALDGQELTYRIEEKDLVSSPIQNEDGILISKQYFVWIDLPENWEKANRLQIFQYAENKSEKKKIVLDVATKKLKKYESRLPKYVDKGTVEEDGFVVSGWYIDDGTAKVKFHDSNGKRLDVIMKTKSRPDVCKVYPENEENEIKGFYARYKGVVPKSVNITFQSKDKKADYTLVLRPSGAEKVKQKAGHYLRKSKTYYQRYGVVYHS